MLHETLKVDHTISCCIGIRFVVNIALWKSISNHSSSILTLGLLSMNAKLYPIISYNIISALQEYISSLDG